MICMRTYSSNKASTYIIGCNLKRSLIIAFSTSSLQNSLAFNFILHFDAFVRGKYGNNMLV